MGTKTTNISIANILTISLHFGVIKISSFKFWWIITTFKFFFICFLKIFFIIITFWEKWPLKFEWLGHALGHKIPPKKKIKRNFNFIRLIALSIFLLLQVRLMNKLWISKIAIFHVLLFYNQAHLLLQLPKVDIVWVWPTMVGHTQSFK